LVNSYYVAVAVVVLGLVPLCIILYSTCAIVLLKCVYVILILFVVPALNRTTEEKIDQSARVKDGRNGNGSE
jgi:membrane protein implicated in regulation of membrane protease activity